MVRSVPVFFVVMALAAQPRAPRSVAELKLFFQANCVKCHGVDGSATGADGKRLKGQDFTSPKEMKGTSDAGLAKTIRDGIFFGKVMPAFKGDLSEQEAKTMVLEIVRKAVKGQPIEPPPAKPEAH